MSTMLYRRLRRFAAGAAMSAALLALVCSASPAVEKVSDGVRQSIDAAVADVKPALVRIHVVSVDYDQGREVKREESGSGVIISKDGYVVTNHHVAGRAKQIVCTLTNKEEVDADLIGTDALADIAVIKLRGRNDFPFAQFSDSSKLAVGDYVLAMGSPLAISQSVTRGIVSNTEMVMPDLFWPSRFRLDGEDVGSIVRWIGHDAQIFPGNSGGPLVDLQGGIVGINEISMGLSGAIPSNLVKQVTQELIAKGKVSRSWIGVETQPLLKSAALQKGVLVSCAVDGSPAYKAGIKPGDVLVKLDGHDVDARYPEELPIFNQMVAALPVGKEVRAVVLRDGKEVPLTITTQERENAQARPVELKEWGICASNVSPFTAREMNRKSCDGALVKSVRPGGAANEAKPDIEEDDVILEVDGKPVKSVADLLDLTKKVTQDKTEPTPTLIAYEREDERYLTVVKIGVRSLEDPGLEAKKAWLPVRTQVLTEDLAQALGVPGRMGVRITHIYPDSAAEKAELKVGDLIVALDGYEIPASQPEDTEVLPSMVRKYKIGVTAELTVIRGKDEMKIPITLPESPRLAREMRKYHDESFEFTCRDVVFHDRAKENWKPGQQGVLVTEVGEGGWAALGRLAVGDLIVSVNGKPAPELEVFQTLMKQLIDEKPKAVTLQVRRGSHELYVELQPTWEAPTASGKTASAATEKPAGQ
ncbi:MAG: PDZ domain-containing protein [Armatimonadota bacterium]|nr:PDZ domain-containing protein [Armatimonadota bacterium]